MIETATADWSAAKIPADGRRREFVYGSSAAIRLCHWPPLAANDEYPPPYLASYSPQFRRRRFAPAIVVTTLSKR